MQEIKRILWVDDHPEIEVSSLFNDGETKKVRLMIDAVKEISSSHLYDYDTIVLDIDFSNGVPDVDAIAEELSKRIYLAPDLPEKNKYIINNGGDLLFIYLLERGYPSKQVAFLTGNPGMLEKLRDYHRKSSANMSNEDIALAYQTAWNDAGDGDDAWDLFVEKIESLPVADEYISEDAIIQCSDYLENNNYEKLKQFISGISPKQVSGNDVKNTGDMMIYRFHEANLESPAFFTKKENYIKGHDKEDAEHWLKDNRTRDRVARWLILSAGYHVKKLFDQDQNAMKTQMANLFSDVETDPGIWSSFSQLYNLFYGLRDIDQKEPYYQAISAMLIPFDKSPYSSGPNATAPGANYDKVQKAFARFSKQCRNYCSHNYFGSSITNETALFIIMGTLAAVLNSSQRLDFDSWFKNAETQFVTNGTYNIQSNLTKIDAIGSSLYSNSEINQDAFNKLHLPNSYAACNPWQMLQAIGYNTKMDLTHEQSSEVREKYFVFTLSAYIVKWFAGISEQDVLSQFGKGIEIIYKVANEIVDAYVYPH